MELSHEEAAAAHIIRVDTTRIDAPNAIQFKEDMRNVTNGLTGRIILDLAQVDFIDSSGLGAVVASMKAMEKDQKLELAALNPMVDKVFRLTRMDTIFAIHSDADSAGAQNVA